MKNKDFSSYTVNETTELLPFLLQVINKSRNSVKSILKRGQVMVDGHIITQHNHPLFSGQKIDILTNKAAKKYAILNGIQIIHEDEAIIVINKDAGVLSMASNNPNELNAYRQLTDFVKYDQPRNRIFIVHRLDRDTSGVMLFAKNEQTKKYLQSNWNEIVKKRLYTALVEGNVKDEQGTISSWLNETTAHYVFSTSEKQEGKHAITHYRKIDGNVQNSLLEVELETGRKNQIRVHMQDIGHPVAGDKKYGATSNPLKRLALHATTLELIHPITKQLESYHVNVPKSFYQQFNSK